jgi:hypothetical protein
MELFLATREDGESEPVETIVVRVEVGNDRMAGTDDPVFLQIGGPGGRDYRLEKRHGRSFQRGKQSVLMLGGAKDSATNVSHPELNDPGAPSMSLDAVSTVRLIKGQEPLPNVRGVGEMDDRLLVERVEVELRCAGGAPSRHFERQGPIWLGLVCGLSIELSEVSKPG